MTTDEMPGSASETATEGTVEDAAVAVPPGIDVDRAIEAILMVADRPQTPIMLATALERPVREVQEAIDRIRADFDGDAGSIRRGFELREIAGGYRVYVREEYDEIVAAYIRTENPPRLSHAALETLAVIAYKQPISRGQVSAIRAVNVDGVVRTLVNRGLIAEAATDEETGAVLYGTTELMLQNLGIRSIDELPHISPLLQDGSAGFEKEPEPVQKRRRATAATEAEESSAPVDAAASSANSAALAVANSAALAVADSSATAPGEDARA